MHFFAKEKTYLIRNKLGKMLYSLYQERTLFDHMIVLYIKAPFG